MFSKEDSKFGGKYRVPSNRLAGYDYSTTGLYFVTICTKDRKEYFGEVVEGKIELSPIGLIVKDVLLKTTELRSNVSIDEWVIMPNHVHVIVGMDNQENEKEWNGRWMDLDADERDAFNASLQRTATYTNVFGPQRKNLSSVIRGFKAATTSRIFKELGISSFAWQPRFHDHIIRTDRSLERIREYIRTNPEKWNEDELYVK